VPMVVMIVVIVMLFTVMAVLMPAAFLPVT
jgi:hypothetical protein